MTDKVQKIREEVERIQLYTQSETLKQILSFIDSLEEEPKECMYSKGNYTDEDRKILCDGCEENCKYNKKETVNDKLGGINNALVQDRIITSKPIGVPADSIELVSIPDKKEPTIPDIVDEHYWEMFGEEPVSEGLKEDIDTYLATYFGSEKEKQEWPFLKKMAIYFAEWQKQKDSIPVSEDLEKAATEYVKSSLVGSPSVKKNAFKAGAKWQREKGESTTDDLGEYINELSKQFPEVSFAKLSRIAVRVSRWQQNQDMKNKLPKVTNRTDLDEYAYQCAYDMSNDWMIDNPTWYDVENACKLGAEWADEHQAEKDLELTVDDIMKLDALLIEMWNRPSNEDKYQEVLKRFKDYKERREK